MAVAWGSHYFFALIEIKLRFEERFMDRVARMDKLKMGYGGEVEW
jgi:hypothetical protein